MGLHWQNSERMLAATKLNAIMWCEWTFCAVGNDERSNEVLTLKKLRELWLWRLRPMETQVGGYFSVPPQLLMSDNKTIYFSQTWQTLNTRTVGWFLTSGFANLSLEPVPSSRGNKLIEFINGRPLTVFTVNCADVEACWTQRPHPPSAPGFTCSFPLQPPAPTPTMEPESTPVLEQISGPILADTHQWTVTETETQNFHPSDARERFTVVVWKKKGESGPKWNGQISRRKRGAFQHNRLTCLEMWTCNKIWQGFPPENSQRYVTGV